ncbi:S8 family peptidase [Hyphobacterium marinum]|uniref:S8 family serine peptidase n=1 Tax=Hyphobacterium marinum TaxID=3116574 RepID=A0ABU7M094_9PROT|nr:S8 family serine peptidase [Hyphobacterium sp. Y6023]MEE2567121.1 S8 family serine peptidase [Hyphobacterium sp. Y6023]
MKTALLAVVACVMSFCLSAGALAQAPADLTETDRQILGEGGRIPVLVMLDVPDLASDLGLDSGPASDAHSTAIASVQDHVLQSVFGAGRTALLDARDRFDARLRNGVAEDGNVPATPVLRHAYHYTPALALTVDGAELTALRSVPGVDRVVTDGRNDAFMDESLPLIGATTLHNAGLTGQGVAVAIVDTGTDIDHPMFAGKEIASACFSSYTPETTSRCPGAGSVEIGPGAGDSCERCDLEAIHGTHVAGTAVGAPFTTTVDEAERTISGVAPGAYLVPVNVFTTIENDTTALDSDLIASLEWLYQNRMLPNPEGGDPIPLVAINMSLGGGRYFDYCYTDPRAPIISLLRSAGVATVIASGNEYYNDSVGGPACVPDAVTVGATDRNDAVVAFSNSFFPVDLLAPGVGIRSATDVVDGEAPGAVALNGTSMATPHVAGAFALLAAAYPDASVTDIEQALRVTGRPVTDPDNNLTRPRINIAAARDYLASLASIEGPIAMTPQLRYFASININRPEEPDPAIYEIRNTGDAAVTVTVASVGNDAIMFGEGIREFSVELLGGEAFDIGVQVDLAEVIDGTLNGTVRVTAPWQGGTQVVQIPATVTGYAGPTTVQRPANDNFSSATRITDSSILLNASTYGATIQAGEPDHDGEDTYGSIWYAIEAIRDGYVRLAMEGRLGRNTIAVYRGNSIAALQQIAAGSQTNDDVILTFEAEEDATYYVALDYAPPPNSLGGESQQPIRFVVDPLVGDYDSFANALELTSPGGVSLVSFAGSTTEDGEDDALSPDFSGTIWMHATGQPGDRLRLAITQVTNTTFLTYYSGSELGNLTELGLASASTFRPFDTTLEIPEGGLYIALQQYGTPSPSERAGEMLFRWQIAPDPAFAQVAAAIAPMARAVRRGGFTTALAAASVGGTLNATDCGVFPERGAPYASRFMPVTPVSGENGDGADIPAGGSQIFAFGGEFSTNPGLGPMAGLELIDLQVVCDNGASPGDRFLSRMHVTISDTPVVDLVASPATTDPLAATLAPNGATRFAVAAVNLGDATEGNVFAVPLAIADERALSLLPDLVFNLVEMVNGNPPFHPLPLDIGICQTDDTGACFSSEGFQPVARLGSIRPNETRTMTVRLTGQGEAVDFAPAANRIVVAFVQVDEFDVENWGQPRLVGMTSVAVRTIEP